MSTRIRNLNAKSLTDEDVVGLSWQGRLVWAYLPCYADREGRLDDKPTSLRMEMLPENPEVDLDEIFNDFQRLGFITRYKVGEKAYVQVKSWNRYQKPYPREPASPRPGPNGEPPGRNLTDLSDLEDQTTSLVRTDESSLSDSEGGGVQGPQPDAPAFDREKSWEMAKAKWAEAGRWPGGENLIAAKKKFHTKVDFRNWPRFWQGLGWAVEASKQSDKRQYLGVLCTFLDEAKWKDQEPPQAEEERKPVDRQAALGSMGY